jgi:hypothetical protein
MIPMRFGSRNLPGKLVQVENISFVRQHHCIQTNPDRRAWQMRRVFASSAENVGRIGADIITFDIPDLASNCPALLPTY